MPVRCISWRHLPVLIGILFIACASGTAEAAELVVSAAASLTNAFRDIGRAYEAAHPGNTVLFNFAASDVLLAQIAKGAPVDVFASADQEAMDKAAAQGLIAASSRRDFARNRLVLIVPADFRLALPNLGALAAPAVQRIAMGNPATVPVGRYTKGVLEKAGVWITLEAKYLYAASVRQALDYVARGEVDAGFVYSTDAAIMKNKVRVAFEAPTDKPILYPVAVLKEGRSAQLAQGFVQFLAAPSAQATLASYGFGKP